MGEGGMVKSGDFGHRHIPDMTVYQLCEKESASAGAATGVADDHITKAPGNYFAAAGYDAD